VFGFLRKGVMDPFRGSTPPSCKFVLINRTCLALTYEDTRENIW
jgi:hypothetical protein